MTQQMTVEAPPLVNGFCPYVNKPYDECYCTKMGSKEIEKMLFFCSKNYKACKIFSRRFQSDSAKSQKLKTAAVFYSDKA